MIYNDMIELEKARAQYDLIVDLLGRFPEGQTPTQVFDLARSVRYRIRILKKQLKN